MRGFLIGIYLIGWGFWQVPAFGAAWKCPEELSQFYPSVGRNHGLIGRFFERGRSASYHVKSIPVDVPDQRKVQPIAPYDFAKVWGAYSELVPFVRRKDLAGALEFIRSPETQNRLGLEFHTVDVILRQGARTESVGDSALNFLEKWPEFWGPSLSIPLLPTVNTYCYLPWLDSNWTKWRGLAPNKLRTAPKVNAAVVPGTIWMMNVEREKTQLGRTQDSAIASFLSPKLQAAAIEYALLAIWEETYHHVDWVFYRQTGRSVSDTLNRFIEQEEIPYSYWRLAELSVVVAALFEADLDMSLTAKHLWRTRHIEQRSLIKHPFFDSIAPLGTHSREPVTSR